MNLKAALLFCLALLGASPPVQAETVQTTSGRVSGVTSDGVDIYRGIPYAAAPVKDLRWTPPQPAPAWKGVRDATKFRPMCPQPPFGDAPITQPMAEDCLFVNVWSPQQKSGAKLPVMVFIHGGGYEGGSGSDPLYDGTRLAQRGVVVVSINYRLGVLGFLAHPALSKASPQRVSGNYGILDQIAALKWVQANIGAFRGDPGRVTIFGESAGGNAAITLMASPLATGLFTQVISESPVGGYPIASLAEAETLGAKLGAIEDLRRLPYEKLLPLNKKILPLAPPMAGVAYPGPILDHWLLEQQPMVHLANPTPLIIGSNADEGRMFAGEGLPPSKAAFDDSLTRMFGPLAQDALAAYSPASESALLQKNAELVGDGLFNYAARHVAAQVTAAGKPVYRYVFGLDMGGRPAMHSDELRYVFGTTQLPGYTDLPAAGATDKVVSDFMMDSWVNFAKTGSPSPAGGTVWPATGPSGLPLLHIDQSPKPLTAYRDDKLDLIGKLYARMLADKAK